MKSFLYAVIATAAIVACSHAQRSPNSEDPQDLGKNLMPGTKLKIDGGVGAIEFSNTSTEAKAVVHKCKLPETDSGIVKECILSAYVPARTRFVMYSNDVLTLRQNSAETALYDFISPTGKEIRLRCKRSTERLSSYVTAAFVTLCFNGSEESTTRGTAKIRVVPPPMSVEPIRYEQPQGDSQSTPVEI